MQKEVTDKILQETEQGYDLISQKFSATRKYFWRGLEFLKDYTQVGDNVLDFGCGNGRLLELLGDVENIEYFGADVSGKLIEIASQKYPRRQFVKIYPVKSSEAGPSTTEFNRASPSQDTLPFEDDYFNTIYSIAVFHHFPSKEYREKMARELYRLTKKDGYVIITVWNLWPAFSASWRIRRGKQKKYFKNIIQNWKNKILGKSQLDWNDCMISFTNNQGIKFQRFHHAFTKRELKKLFEHAGFETEKCEVVGGRNILYVGKRFKI